MYGFFLRGHIVYIQVPRALKEQVKQVVGSFWSNEHKLWTVPATPLALCNLADAFPRHAYADLYTPEVDRLLVMARKRAQSYTAALTLTKEPPDTLHAPWHHQLQAFNYAASRPAAWLGMDMGTGKTKVAYDLLAQWQAGVILIVCPVNVLPVWPRELAKHTVRQYDVLPCTVKLPAQRRAQDIAEFLHPPDGWARNDRPHIVLLNYDILWRPPIQAVLKKERFDCIVADESHRIKDPQGAVSLALADLGWRARRRLALTGTPMPHSPLDAFGQCRFLEPGLFGANFTRFKERYCSELTCTRKDEQKFSKITGYKNQEEFTERLSRVLFQVKKRDVLDLPPYLEQPYEQPFPDRKPYDTLKRKFVLDTQEGRITANNALTRVLRLMQMTGGFITHDMVDGVQTVERWDKTKETMLADLLLDLPDDEQVVVFAHFKADLQVAREVLERTGRRVLEVSGRAHDLDGVLPREPGLSLVCQPKSGGLGIDCTASCYGVYYSMSHDGGDYLQACARLDRPGQTRPVTMVPLLVDNTVDGVVYQAHKNKQDVVSAVLHAVQENILW